MIASRSTNKRRCQIVAGLFVCIAGVLAAANEARADASVVVDASQVVSNSGDDDLATLQNIFQGANIPAEPAAEPARTLLRQVMADLKMKRVRLLQSDNTCDLDADGTLGSVTVTGFDPMWSALLGYDSYYLFSPSDGSGACNLIDWTLVWALDNGLSPHFAVASFLPPSFEKYGAAETWAQKTDPQGHPVLELYKSYARQLVRFVLTRSFEGGAPSVVFEVSNELDIADSQPLNWDLNNPTTALLPPLRPWGRSLWWIDPSSYNLFGPPGIPASYPFVIDSRRVEHGIAPMQKIYADIIDDIRKGHDPVLGNQYAGKTIEIAGPAFSGTGFGWYPVPFDENGVPKTPQPTLEERFLDQILDANMLGGILNAPLDRFSFHYYGDFRNGFNWIPNSGPYTTLKAMTGTIKAKLAALGHPDIKLFLSEWGPVANDNPAVSPSPVINYSHAGAAWAAAFLAEAVDDGVSMGSFLALSDAAGADANGDIYAQSLTHKVTDGDGTVHYYPKPVANVFKMFAMMTGTRKDATASAVAGVSSNVGVFAATDANSAHVVLYNYNDDLVFHNDNQDKPDTPESVSVTLNHLPFNGQVYVQRYLVDANTSNLKAFIENPAHPQPDLQLVETCVAQVQEGQLSLPSRSLGLGVSYWRVTQQTPDDAGYACVP
jgi:hypothetical protein